MELETKIAQPSFAKTILYNVQRSHFLGDEQNAETFRKCRSNYVCYCLRFAGARWAFEGYVFFIQDIHDGAKLRRIRFSNEERHLFSNRWIVDFVLLSDK